MTKVQNFKNNFWKRGINRVVVTPVSDGFECKIELYSFNKRFLGSRVIPSYQLSDELICLGGKRLDLQVGVI